MCVEIISSVFVIASVAKQSHDLQPDSYFYYFSFLCHAELVSASYFLFLFLLLTIIFFLLFFHLLIR